MMCVCALLQVEDIHIPGQPSNISCLQAKLSEPLKAGSSVDVELYSVHIGLMTPFPATAAQSDPQRVLLKGSHYVPSPYPVAKQTSKASICSLPCHCQHALNRILLQGGVADAMLYDLLTPLLLLQAWCGMRHDLVHISVCGYHSLPAAVCNPMTQCCLHNANVLLYEAAKDLIVYLLCPSSSSICSSNTVLVLSSSNCQQ